MHDFGEYLPLDAVLFDGSDPVEYHSRYPVEWQRLGEAAVAAAAAATAGSAVAGSTEAEAEAEDIVWFSRSGSSASPSHARLFW